MKRLLHKVKTWIGKAPAAGNGQVVPDPDITVDPPDEVTDTRTALSRTALLSRSLVARATELANGKEDETNVE